MAVIGLEDPGFLTLLAVRTADFTKRLRPDCDVILLGVEKTSALGKIKATAARMKPSGGLWIVYPKGRKDITQAQVMEAGLAAGLVDNKVCSFSATLTALRFVVRVKDRPGKQSAH